MLAVALAGLFFLQDVPASGPPRVAVVAPEAHPGAFFLPLTLEEQVAQAGRVIVGRVLTVDSRFDAGTIVTDVRLLVEQDIKGEGNQSFTVLSDLRAEGGMFVL